MKPRLPVMGIFLALGLALLGAGCVTAPTRAAQAGDFRTFGIVVVDDRGTLSPPELDRIQVGVVQYLVSAGYVRSGQVLVPDIRSADVVFQVTIAWEGAGNRYTIVGVAPVSAGVAVAGAPAYSPAYAPAYAGVPYDPWYDGYYDYPDFGYAYEPYLPFFGVGAFIPFLDHPFRGGSHFRGDRDRDHRPSWRHGDRQSPHSGRPGGRSPSAGSHGRPGGPDSDKRRPPPDTWRSHDIGPGFRSPAVNPPARPPDRAGPGSRPPPRRTDRDAHQPPPDHRAPPAAVSSRPPPDHRRPPATVSPRPPPPERRPPPAAVTSRPPPPDRRHAPAAVATRPPPPDRRPSADRVDRRPARDSSARQAPARRADPAPAPRREYAARPPARPSAERSAPPPRRTESAQPSRHSDSGGRASSPSSSRGGGDSRPSRSDSGDSDRRGGRNHDR